MKRFTSVLAGAALALSGSLAFAGTQLPAEFGGGFVPPDSATNKVEQGVAKALTKLAASVTKCHQKGVGNVLKAKPSGVNACDSGVVAKYTAGTAKLGGVACIDAAAQTTLGGNVAALVESFDGTLWCDGTVALDAEFGGGFVPSSSDANKTQQGVSKVLIKHVGAVSKCVLKGVGNIIKAKPDGLTACIDAARVKADASAAKLAAGIALLGPDPDCLKNANSPTNLLDVVTALTLGFNGAIFCQSPSGAFLN